VHYYLRKPDGTTLTSSTFNVSSSLVWQQLVLPVSGIYTLLVDPSGTTIGSATVKVVYANVPGVVSIGGPAASASITDAGQTATFTLDAVAGQTVLADKAYTSRPTAGICAGVASRRAFRARQIRTPTGGSRGPGAGARPRSTWPSTRCACGALGHRQIRAFGKHDPLAL